MAATASPRNAKLSRPRVFDQRLALRELTQAHGLLELVVMIDHLIELEHRGLNTAAPYLSISRQ